MPNDLQNIQKLAKMLEGHQMLTTQELTGFVTDIVNAFASMRSNHKEMTQEHKDILNLAIKQLNAEHDRILASVSHETKAVRSDMEAKVKGLLDEAKLLKSELMAMKPQDGIPGEKGADGLPGRDGSPDTGEQIVDKINSQEKKIKAKNIEGLDKRISQNTQHIISSGVNKIIAGTNVTVTSSQGNGKGDITISSTGGVGGGQVNAVVAGTGISVDATDPANPIVTNSSPDQTVAITAGTNITSVTGTYPNFTINAATQAGGTGDVTKVGTPVNNQVGVWTGDGTIEGDTALTFDTTTDTLATTNITATTVTANLVGNVTGNVSGSSGSTTGNAATVTTNANLTGVVTSTGNATAIADSALSIAKTSGLQTALDGKQASLGFTAENVANKSITLSTDQASDTKYPSVKSVYDWATGLFATISNLALKAPLASPTFTGTVVLPNSQALVTPVLGTPTSGTLTNCTGLPAASVVAGVLGVTGTRMTKLWATDIESTNSPTVGGVVVPTISSTSTLTNKRVNPRFTTATSYTTSTTIDSDANDQYIITAQAGALLFNNPTGTPVDGQRLIIAVTGTAARALTWGTAFEASTVALPTTTVTTARLNIGFIWRADTSKWVCVASA